MNVLIHNSGIRASPHIENKYRMLKKQYSIVFDMVNTSVFSWNDVKKCVQVDSDEAWLTYTQVSFFIDYLFLFSCIFYDFSLI